MGGARALRASIPGRARRFLNKKLGRGWALFSRMPLPHSRLRGRLSTSDDARGKSNDSAMPSSARLQAHAKEVSRAALLDPTFGLSRGLRFKQKGQESGFTGIRLATMRAGMSSSRQSLRALPARRPGAQICSAAGGTAPARLPGCLLLGPGVARMGMAGCRAGAARGPTLSLCRPGHHRCAVALPVRNQHAILRGALAHLRGRSWKTLAAQRRKR